MNHRCRRPQGSSDRCQVLDITRQHVVGKSEGYGDEMSINDIVGARRCQQTTNESAIVEGDHLGRLEKLGQAGLSASVSPYLRDDWLGRPKYRCPAFCRG